MISLSRMGQASAPEDNPSRLSRPAARPARRTYRGKPEALPAESSGDA
jgi:hypothetical protein